MNVSTVLIGILIAFLVILDFRYLRRNGISDCSDCSGGCAGCTGKASCHIAEDIQNARRKITGR